MLLPEPLEIARDLQRPLIGRQEMEHERHPAVADGGRFFETEKILQAGGERRGLAADILNRDFFFGRAGRMIRGRGG